MSFWMLYKGGVSSKAGYTVDECKTALWCPSIPHSAAPIRNIYEYYIQCIYTQRALYIIYYKHGVNGNSTLNWSILPGCANVLLLLLHPHMRYNSQQIQSSIFRQNQCFFSCIRKQYVFPGSLNLFSLYMRIYLIGNLLLRNTFSLWV